MGTTKKPTPVQVQKERSPAKREDVLEKKGYSGGKLPTGKELHHVKPVSEGGKTTKTNTRVVPEKKHDKIHSNRGKKRKV